MKIILKQTIEKLGLLGDLIDVKPGFARNYLLPLGIAVIATKHNLLLSKKRKHRIIEEKSKILNEAKFKSQKILEKKFVVKALTSKNGKLFGSISPKEISDVILEETGIKIAKSNIIINKTIRQLGNYKIKLRLCNDFFVNCDLQIESKVLQKL